MAFRWQRELFLDRVCSLDRPERSQHRKYCFYEIYICPCLTSMLYLRNRSSTCFSLLSCSTILPLILQYPLTDSIIRLSWTMFETDLWYTSPADVNPYGNLVKEYMPRGVLNIQSFWLSLLSLIYQYPETASDFTNTFASEISSKTSSIVFIG